MTDALAFEARDRTRTLFGQTMGLVAATAGLFALGRTSGATSPTSWAWYGSSPPSPA